MQHQGLAPELSRALADDRDRAVNRPRPRRRSDRSFDHLLSIGGAAMLLALALAGPLVAVAVSAAIAVAIAAAHRPPAEEPRTPRVRAASAPRDRWWMWRIVEADAPGSGRRAA
jgi:hypothetical protein